MRLGIIARSDNTGLGNQTKELVDMLKPTKILLIDSTPFNKNKQHPEWYKDYDCIKSTGFPTLQQIKLFLREVDIVISCETFYDQNFVKYAKRYGVKTILQYNYELFGNLASPNLALPDVLLSPSVWHIDHVKKLFGKQSNVIHLPPPTNPSIFSDAMVLPRRYAGLCLPMNEALMSALPVFMTDISPNNYILPKEWLVETSLISLFRTKVRIELFEANKEKLANQIDEYVNNKNKNEYKEKAYQIGNDNFNPENLVDKYLEIISHI